MTLVSVLMPSYNHAPFVGEAIDSVLAQSFADLELIVVDDASRDGSPAIIRARAAADRRIRPVLQDRNRGIAHTFNTALGLARGRFVAFLASDDLWVPSKLERQMIVLRRRPGAIVYSEAMLVDAAGRALGLALSRCTDVPEVPEEGLFERLLRGRLIALSSLMAGADLVRQFGFDERLVYFNDYKLLLQLARGGSFQFLPEPLLLYRRHATNVTTFRDTDGWSADAERIRAEVLGTYGDEMNQDLRASFEAYIDRLVPFRKGREPQGVR